MTGESNTCPGIPVGPGAWDWAYLWVVALGHTLGPALMHGHNYVEYILIIYIHRAAAGAASCTAVLVRYRLIGDPGIRRIVRMYAGKYIQNHREFPY
eukprot:COSAG02_NODE_6373_length_3616_cov_7.980665_2_plen_97_part_00